METQHGKGINFAEGVAKIEAKRAVAIIRGLLAPVGSPEDMQLQQEVEALDGNQGNTHHGRSEQNGNQELPISSSIIEPTEP